MPLVKSVKGILITKRQKVFDGGGAGFYCEILTVDSEGVETVMPFWADISLGKEMGEDQTVRGWEVAKARQWEIAMSTYGDKQKRHLVSVK